MKRILKFTAPWCAPCKQLNSVLESVTSAIPIQSVDIDENPDLAQQYSVRGIPVMIKLDEDIEVERIVGPRGREFLNRWTNS